MLERALGLGAPEGNVRSVLDEGAPLLVLLRALRQSVQASYVEQLLSAMA